MAEDFPALVSSPLPGWAKTHEEGRGEDKTPPSTKSDGRAGPLPSQTGGEAWQQARSNKGGALFAAHPSCMAGWPASSPPPQPGRGGLCCKAMFAELEGQGRGGHKRPNDRPSHFLQHGEGRGLKVGLGLKRLRLCPDSRALPTRRPLPSSVWKAPGKQLDPQLPQHCAFPQHTLTLEKPRQFAPDSSFKACWPLCTRFFSSLLSFALHNCLPFPLQLHHPAPKLKINAPIKIAGSKKAGNCPPWWRNYPYYKGS